jgi:hypothetical protein
LELATLHIKIFIQSWVTQKSTLAGLPIQSFADGTRVVIDVIANEIVSRLLDEASGKILAQQIRHAMRVRDTATESAIAQKQWLSWFVYNGCGFMKRALDCTVEALPAAQAR